MRNDKTSRKAGRAQRRKTATPKRGNASAGARWRVLHQGIPFRWRPFHLLVILQEMKHVPCADKPIKMAYMWRDVERRAAMYGIPVQVPAPYPAKQSVVANLVATVGMREGWGPDFVRAAYRHWFQLGQETGSEPNLSESLRDLGQDPTPSRRRALLCAA